MICAFFDTCLPARAGLALAALLYLVWAVWLTKMEAISAPLKLNPLVLYQLWQAATLGVAPLYVAGTNLGGASIPLGNQNVPLEWVAYGHAVMVIGSWAFYVGMKQFAPHSTARGLARPSPVSPLFLVAAAAIGSVFLAAREAVTQYVGSTVAQLSILPTAVLCLVALKPRSAREHSDNRRFCILLFGSLGLMALNSRRDSKMELILSFFPLVWWLVIRRKRGLMLLAAPALAAFYVLAVAPLVSATRNDKSARDDTGGVSVLNAGSTQQIIAGMREIWTAGPGRYAWNWLDITMLRTCDPVAAGLVASLAERDGFQFGSGLDYVPLSFIPRAVWPGKPSVNPGVTFSTMLGMVSASGSVYTCTGTTAAGELYWNFGWPGALLGMYLLGAAVAGLWWRAAGADPRQGLFEMTAYTGAMLSFVLGTGAAAGPLLTTCVSAGIIWRLLVGFRRKLLAGKAAAMGARVYA